MKPYTTTTRKFPETEFSNIVTVYPDLFKALRSRMKSNSQIDHINRAGKVLYRKED